MSCRGKSCGSDASALLGVDCWLQLRWLSGPRADCGADLVEAVLTEVVLVGILADGWFSQTLSSNRTVWQFVNSTATARFYFTWFGTSFRKRQV